jgi:hypothetical protein
MMPDAVCRLCTWLTSAMMILRTEAGAAALIWVISGRVADWCTSPSSETSTRMPGKTDWIP